MNTWFIYSCVNFGIESVLGTGNVYAFSDSVTRLYECSYGFIARKLPLQSRTQAGEVPAWIRGELHAVSEH